MRVNRRRPSTDVNKPYSVETVELDPPKAAARVLIRWARPASWSERSALPEGRGHHPPLPAVAGPRGRPGRCRAPWAEGRHDGEARRTRVES